MKKYLDIFGEKVREKRKEKGLTQAELAFRLSITQSTLCKWESGKTSIPLYFGIVLSEVLDFEIPELFGIKKAEKLEEMYFLPLLEMEESIQ